MIRKFVIKQKWLYQYISLILIVHFLVQSAFYDQDWYKANEVMISHGVALVLFSSLFVGSYLNRDCHWKKCGTLGLISFCLVNIAYELYLIGDSYITIARVGILLLALGAMQYFRIKQQKESLNGKK